MIRLLLVIIILLTLPQRQIEVVLIQPDGEEFTQEEQERAVQAIQESIDWWHELAPPPYTLEIGSVILITTTSDILYDTTRPEHIEDLGVFVIDNSSSGRYLKDRYVGLATNNAIWTLTSAGPWTYIHEFGHMLYTLPHQEGTDIMSPDPVTAYQQHVLGCGTSIYLGLGCSNSVIEYTYYIPMVTQ